MPNFPSQLRYHTTLSNIHSGRYLHPNLTLTSAVNLRNLYSSSIPELIHGRDPAFLDIDKTSRQLSTRIIGVGFTTITCETSGSSSGKTWSQIFQIPSLPDKIRDLNKDYQKAVEWILSSADVFLYCECPAFHWFGYEYIAAQLNYLYGGGQDIAPDQTNPDQRGTVCKHLLSALRALQSNQSSLVSQFEDLYQDYPWDLYSQADLVSQVVSRI